ncbi:MAG: acyl-CoA synthetase forming [Actinomycetia bacterium]|nr:acyl-CoA synthetase forming [Actinomycetes bacterium]
MIVEQEQVALTDGRMVDVRPIRPDDAQRLAELHARLSPESVRRRYFTAHPVLSPTELHRFTHVDGDTRLALVAILDDAIVGVGRYESIPDTGTVEVAFVVRDDLQGLGLGCRLVELVAAAAAAHGKTELLAETLPENQAMRRALHHAGRTTSTFRDGVVEVRVPIGVVTGSRAAEPPP